jgi:hypothetical protein
LTFFDVRISNPEAPSKRSQTIAAVYKKNEREKMKAYEDRILQVEKGSFVPLVYTTTVGMGPLCERLHKRIAQLLADKRDERYSDVMNHLRTRLRFSLLKSILVSVRGARGARAQSMKEDKLSNISFNLIQYFRSNEGY